MKALIIHLVENYRDKLKDITYVDTFQNLILRYDQMHEPQPDLDQSFTSVESDTPNRGIVNGGQRWQGLRDADAEEEAYFNGSDNEEDEENLPTAAVAKPVANGASPLRPLVSYPDDEDDDTMDILAEPDSTSLEQAKRPTVCEDAPPNLQTPPERLAEKRRREEDEEDELGKLSTTTKRRSSSVSSARSIASNAGATGQPLRRKKSFNSGKDGPPKKIAISLAIKGGGNGAGDEGGV